MTQLDPTPEREGTGGRVVVLLLLGLIVLFGGAYAAAYFFAGDKVPRGTTVAGVDIGGHEQDEAAAVLEEGLADRVGQSVTLQVGGKAQQLNPRQAGMEVDYTASVADAGGERSWHPVRLWHHFTGGEEHEAVVTYDEDRVEEIFDGLDERFGERPVNGAVVFQGADVRVREAEDGRLLDRDVAREAIEEAWLGDADRAELALVTREPDIGQGAVQQAREEFADPAVSGPVAIKFGDVKPVRLGPAHFTRALSMVADEGQLVPRLDEKQLVKVIDARTGEANKPVDAQVRLVNGRPKVIPAKPGVSYDTQQVTEGFLDLVTRPKGERRLEVDAETTPPDRTTKEARQLGVEEKVSTFTTHYPHAEYRNVNIGQAAENINGTLLEPGETFSFNDTVGERTAANGFTQGFIIADGILKEDYGGGVSQMATTMFNAMFFAGLEDVEHKPHSFYIDRYPIGREATVVWGALDLRFKNDTDHGVLIQSFIDPSSPGGQGSVTVNMWSTKTWDISTTASDRYNFTSPDTRRITDPTCTPHTGYGGFDIDVTRIFRKPGSNEVVDRETFHTTYTPSDTVLCVEPEPEPTTGGGNGGNGGGNNNGGGGGNNNGAGGNDGGGNGGGNNRGGNNGGGGNNG